MRVPSRVLFWAYGGFLVTVISFLLFVRGYDHSGDDEWIDPYDMLNYDSTSKSMRKPTEASNYNNVPTKRREYTEVSCQAAQCPDVKECADRVGMLQRELEDHKRSVTFSSQQPTCNPVFKRFLAKLLKQIERLGLPGAVTAEMHYDAEVKLSGQMVAEIQTLVNGEGSWRTGAMDDALSQVLINFKLHDREAWKWHFEDTFGVELDTIIKVFVMVLIIVMIICTEMWSVVSWFVQFKRMFAICLVMSLVWNWLYLYKTAFAEHQANILKMESVSDKCSGLKRIDWLDSLKEWYRRTLTLQDDPCEQYYEILIVNPILVVPPIKAVTMTITSFFTEPLKHIGQGFSEFLRALLKDLPVTLQMPVLLLIALAIVVYVYSIGQAVVHHAFLRPLRGGHQDPPPGIAQQPAAPPLQEREERREEQRERLARGDADHDAQPRHYRGQDGHQANDLGNQRHDRPEIRQRRPNRPRHEQQKVSVETLGNADSLYSGDETDARQEAAAEGREPHVEEEKNEGSASSSEIKLTKPESKKDNAEPDIKEDKTLGDTGVGGGLSEAANTVENIGPPVHQVVRPEL